MQPFPVGPSTFEAIWEGRDAAPAALITQLGIWSTAELRSEWNASPAPSHPRSWGYTGGWDLMTPQADQLARHGSSGWRL